jgi:hypothetical protein
MKSGRAADLAAVTAGLPGRWVESSAPPEDHGTRSVNTRTAPSSARSPKHCPTEHGTFPLYPSGRRASSASAFSPRLGDRAGEARESQHSRARVYRQASRHAVPSDGVASAARLTKSPSAFRTDQPSPFRPSHGNDRPTAEQWTPRPGNVPLPGAATSLPPRRTEPAAVGQSPIKGRYGGTRGPPLGSGRCRNPHRTRSSSLTPRSSHHVSPRSQPPRTEHRGRGLRRRQAGHHETSLIAGLAPDAPGRQSIK